MELSQLSVALPGTNQVCTVLSITNNLLSTLYSWQLVFTSKGLAPSSATGAVLLNNTGEAHWLHLLDELIIMDKVTQISCSVPYANGRVGGHAALRKIS
jgi:hypothetical protein